MGQQVSALWSNAPAVTKCVLGSHCAISVFSLLVPPVGRLFRLSLASLVSYGNILPLMWFWLATPLGGNPVLGLLFLLFAAWAAFVYMGRLEQEYGSVRFCAWLLMSSVAIGTLYLLVVLLISQFVPSYRYDSCSGLWPLLVLAMTTRSLAEPQGATQSIWGIVQIPSRWYPLVLILFFSVISMSPQVELIAAWFLGVGARQAEGEQPLHPNLAWLKLPFYRLLPSLDTVTALEVDASSGAGQQLGGVGSSGASAARLLRDCPVAVARAVARSSPASLRSSYVSSSAASGGTAHFGSKASGPSRGLSGSTIGRAEDHKFKVFSGGGHRLGEESAAEP